MAVPASLRRPPALAAVLTARVLLCRLRDENAALQRRISTLRAWSPASSEEAPPTPLRRDPRFPPRPRSRP